MVLNVTTRKPIACGCQQRFLLQVMDASKPRDMNVGRGLDTLSSWPILNTVESTQVESVPVGLPIVSEIVLCKHQYKRMPQSSRSSIEVSTSAGRKFKQYLQQNCP